MMRSRLFSLLFSAAIFTTNPLFAMDQSVPLDRTWNQGIKLEQAINMPLAENNRVFYSNIQRVGPYNSQVLVIDGSPDLSAFPVATRGAPTNLAHNVLQNAHLQTHGTHVMHTIMRVAPSTIIHSHQNIQTLTDVMKYLDNATQLPEIDIINLSLGPKPGQCTRQELDSYLTSIAKTLIAGKIVVASLGNSQQNYSQDDLNQLIKDFTDLASNCAKNSAIKGRLILVGNASYENGREELHPTSSRSTLKDNDAIITGPGTNITALGSSREYQTKSGTSMATPIVSGVMSQLLGEFREEFIKTGITDRADMRKFVAEIALRSARTTHLNTGEKLPDSFGRGVINYGAAKEGINTFLEKVVERAGLKQMIHMHLKDLPKDQQYQRLMNIRKDPSKGEDDIFAAVYG